MKNKIVLLFVMLTVTGTASLLFSAGGGGAKNRGTLLLGSTEVAQGAIKVAETLTTREGQSIPPGVYRISIGLSSTGQAQFSLSPFKSDSGTSPKTSNLEAAQEAQKEKNAQVIISAEVMKNTFVRGIASNIQGEFHLEILTPTEVSLSFDSNQFTATTALGRSLNSKVIDLSPSTITFENPTDCGPDCVEGNVKVTVRNDGNSIAKGKWNVVLLTPQFFVGTISDVPTGEVSITSDNKLKMSLAHPKNVTVQVRADFYNKDATDSNDSNNSKTFSLNVKQ